MTRVWLITGCSSGFGKEIVLAALKLGDTVVATARDVNKIKDLEQKGALVRKLDVVSSDEVLKDVAQEVINSVGRIDILVNNAGYALLGAVEECSAQEVQTQFATNVFGQLNVLRAVLPHMRSRRSGVVANIGSIAGWKGSSTGGLYCASKAALTVLTESLKVEVEDLGIEVTTIEPGYFRTSFLSQGHQVMATRRIADLEKATAGARQGLKDYDHHQPGDPRKGAQIIVEALTKTGRCQGKPLPARLALGNDAVKYIGGAIDNYRRQLDHWAEIVSTTDCDDVSM